MAWRIAPWTPADRDEVGAFILGIQAGEFGLPITLADQPDLADVPGFYLAGARGPGGFWVARAESGEVVGTIAVLNIGPDAHGNGQGALRKMFVAPAARGAGLAAMLLRTLEGWCAQSGLRRLFLGTTDRYLAAHRFYAKQGFARIGKAALPPTFPVMAVDTVFFAKSL